MTPTGCGCFSSHTFTVPSPWPERINLSSGLNATDMALLPQHEIPSPLGSDSVVLNSRSRCQSEVSHSLKPLRSPVVNSLEPSRFRANILIVSSTGIVFLVVLVAISHIRIVSSPLAE